MIFPDIRHVTEWTRVMNYLKLGLPTMVMLCTEWWAFEILILLSGLISVRAQASQVLLANMCAQMFMIPLGLQDATCVLIGNAIGDNNLKLG